jgi:hypothetical protein
MYDDTMKIQQMLFLPDVTPRLHWDPKKLLVDNPIPWLNTRISEFFSTGR